MTDIVIAPSFDDAMKQPWELSYLGTLYIMRHGDSIDRQTFSTLARKAIETGEGEELRHKFPLFVEFVNERYAIGSLEQLERELREGTLQ
jgi:hypothetical protein